MSDAAAPAVADPVAALANQPYLRLRCLELAAQLAAPVSRETTTAEVIAAARSFYYFCLPKSDAEPES